MASNSFFLLTVALFIVGSAAKPATKAADLITSVCSKTIDPPQCNEALRANPQSAKADLEGLAFISLDIASNNAKKTSSLVASLLKSATDKKLKARFSSCLKNIQDSFDRLDIARQALNEQDIGTYIAAASAAEDGPSTCDDGFVGPPAEPLQLQQADKKLQVLCSIVLAVGKSLSG